MQLSPERSGSSCMVYQMHAAQKQAEQVPGLADTPAIWLPAQREGHTGSNDPQQLPPLRKYINAPDVYLPMSNELVFTNIPSQYRCTLYLPAGISPTVSFSLIK